MKNEINLGDLLFDSHPDYRKRALIMYLVTFIVFSVTIYVIIINNRTLSIMVFMILLVGKIHNIGYPFILNMNGSQHRLP